MATAKRKQEELGEECDDQEQHDNECSDEEEAKRPRLDLHHMHHQLPHRQWSQTPGEAPARDHHTPGSPPVSCSAGTTFNHDAYYPEYPPYKEEEAPCDLSNWQVRRFEDLRSGDSDNLNSDNVSVDEEQPINFAYYHF